MQINYAFAKQTRMNKTQMVVFLIAWLILLRVAISECCLVFVNLELDRWHTQLGIFRMSAARHSVHNAIYRGFTQPRYITCNLKLEQQTNFICSVNTAFTKQGLSVNKHCRSGCAMNWYVPTLFFDVQWAFSREMLNFEPERFFFTKRCLWYRSENYFFFLLIQKRLRWSRGSVLAFRTQVRGFKPGRSRRIFKGEKKSSARLPSEGK